MLDVLRLVLGQDLADRVVDAELARDRLQHLR
jgi:hypothetical protein